MTKFDPRITWHPSSMHVVQTNVMQNKWVRTANLKATLTCVAALAAELFDLLLKKTLCGGTKGLFRTVCLQSGSPNWVAWKSSASKTANYAIAMFLSIGSVLFAKRLSKTNVEFQLRNNLFQTSELPQLASDVGQYPGHIQSKREAFKKATHSLNQLGPNQLNNIEAFIKDVDAELEKIPSMTTALSANGHFRGEGGLGVQGFLANYNLELTTYKKDALSELHYVLSIRLQVVPSIISTYRKGLEAARLDVPKEPPINLEKLKEVEKQLKELLGKSDNLIKEFNSYKTLIDRFKAQFSKEDGTKIESLFALATKSMESHCQLHETVEEEFEEINTTRDFFEKDLIMLNSSFFHFFLEELTVLSKFVSKYRKANALQNPSDFHNLVERKSKILKVANGPNYLNPQTPAKSLNSLKSDLDDFKNKLEKTQSKFTTKWLDETLEKVVQTLSVIDQAKGYINNVASQLEAKIKTLSDKKGNALQETPIANQSDVEPFIKQILERIEQEKLQLPTKIADLRNQLKTHNSSLYDEEGWGKLVIFFNTFRHIQVITHACKRVNISVEAKIPENIEEKLTVLSKLFPGRIETYDFGSKLIEIQSLAKEWVS